MLHYYPQYRLEDFDAMSPAMWRYLIGGMLDNMSPGLTEDPESRASRLVRESMERRISKRGR